MTAKQKNYLIIKNVYRDKNLVNYLEKICQEENVKIVYEEVSSFDLFNQKKSIYTEFNANQTKDILLWSYSIPKLEYINYLYTDFEARYKITSRAVNNILNEKNTKTTTEETIKSYKPDGEYTFYVNCDFNNEENLDEDNKRLKMVIQDYLSFDWITPSITSLNNISTSNKKLTFKQKISNFFDKHSDKIRYFCYGIMLNSLIYMVIFTLQHFIVK